MGLYEIFNGSKDSLNELQIRNNLGYDQILNPIVLLITYLIISFSSDTILVRNLLNFIKIYVFYLFFSQKKEKRKSVKLKSKEKHKIDKIKTQIKVNKNITDNKNRPSYESNPESLNIYKIKTYGEFVYKNFCDIIYNNFYIVTNVFMMVINIK